MKQPRVVNLTRYVWRHPENRRRRFRALARLMAWQVWQRAVRRPITIRLESPAGKPANPPRLKCYPHSMVASSVLYCGFNEYQDMHFAADYLADGDTFVDVGANIGVYSLLAAASAEVEVFAFEPSSAAGARFIENIELNGLADRIHLIIAAAGDVPGEAQLTCGLDAMNRVVESAGESAGVETEAVRVVTLDDAIAKDIYPDVALMKIDVEGREEHVIAGALELIKASRPALIVEVSDSDVIRTSVEGLGYKPCRYDPVTRELSLSNWTDRSGNNLLLINDLDIARERLG